MSTLFLLHFNDAYTLRQKDFDVSHFAGTVEKIQEEWPKDVDGRPAGLFLFSGDIFNPSVESIFTRGHHMVPVLNALSIDAACPGNHDFDFGAPQLAKLAGECKFPWILSNIIDTRTEKSWSLPYWVAHRNGIKIGIIGLVEADWISTVMNWDPMLVHTSMVEKAIQLSKQLRDPDGPEAVDLIIALTHNRLPNDINLAKACMARRVLGKNDDLASQHGIDLILGGHDHFYYVGKGCHPFEDAETPPNGVNVTQKPHDDDGVYGSEYDDGFLVIKSGTDFRDLSSIELILQDARPGSIRRKLITEVRGKRHWINSESFSSFPMKVVMERVLADVDKALHVPICATLTPWDVRSEFVRTSESPVGNWVADCLFTGYDELMEDSLTISASLVDAVLICAGSLRTDMTYPSGVMSAYEVVRILPFDDPIVVIEVTGQALWEALECSLSLYPALEGRFPVISGMKVIWDASAPPMKRLRAVFFLDNYRERRPKRGRAYNPQTISQNTHAKLQSQEISPFEKTHNSAEEFKEESTSGVMHYPVRPQLLIREALDVTKTYRLVTAEYMAQGYDGFHALKDCNHIVNEASGLMMCDVVRRHLVSKNMLRLGQLPNESAHHLFGESLPGLEGECGIDPEVLGRIILQGDLNLPVIAPRLDGRLQQINSFTT